MDSGVKLIRIRNPWGNSKEWKGPWSDSSEELMALSEDEKTKHDIVKEYDGEFFMSVQDFQKHFEGFDICNLTQESLDESDPR